MLSECECTEDDLSFSVDDQHLSIWASNEDSISSPTIKASPLIPLEDPTQVIDLNETFNLLEFSPFHSPILSPMSVKALSKYRSQKASTPTVNMTQFCSDLTPTFSSPPYTEALLVPGKNNDVVITTQANPEKNDGTHLIFDIKNISEAQSPQLLIPCEYSPLQNKYFEQSFEDDEDDDDLKICEKENRNPPPQIKQRQSVSKQHLKYISDHITFGCESSTPKISSPPITVKLITRESILSTITNNTSTH